MWHKITLALEKKKGGQKVVEKVAKNVPERSKQHYERTWKEFETFTGKVGDEEPTEEDYLKFFNYLAEVRKCKWSSLYAYFSRLNTGHQTRHGVFELCLSLSSNQNIYATNVGEKFRYLNQTNLGLGLMHIFLKNNPKSFPCLSSNAM